MGLTGNKNSLPKVSSDIIFSQALPALKEDPILSGIIQKKEIWIQKYGGHCFINYINN
jgi:hypothetical protein